VKPLYAELAKNAEHKKWALEVFAKAKENYHAITAGTIEDILNK
jgi:hypothetical protein